MTREKKSISEEQKKNFCGIYLLNFITNKPHYFALLLIDNDKDLEPVLEWLMMKNYIEIKDSEKYIPTKKGHEVLTLFLKRYTDFVSVFDIYSAVDLENGEFAFSRYFDFESDAEFANYINDEKWDDLRLAVCDFKGLAPIEIVFMSFINEERISTKRTGWQFDLVLGSVWNEILDICNNAIYKEDLAYEDEMGHVTGDMVIKDIITQGAEINIELKKKEAEKSDDNDEGGSSFSEFDNEDESEEYIMDPVLINRYPVDYYYHYRDPFYINPIWMALWII